MMIWNILLTILFVLLNAFFVAAEFAIVKVRSSTVEVRSRSGSYLAKISKNIIKDLDVYLSATQLGITMASLALGWIGEGVVAEMIMDSIHFFGFNITEELAHQISLPVAFASITFLHIVFGELAPKNLAIQYPEKTTYVVSIPLLLFHWTFKPIIWVLNAFANMIIRMSGLQVASESEGSAHSPEEFRVILQESSDKGSIDAAEQELIENVFDFTETPVRQVMVPRNKVVAVEVRTPIEQVLDKFLDEGYSRMPVYNQSIDNIIGVIYAKDLISIFKHKDVIIMHDIMRKPYFVQENDLISLILKQMQANKVHLAIVLDEFNGTSGVVSLEDILEELVGEIQDEYDEELPQFKKIEENKYFAIATLPIDDLNDLLPKPLRESEDYETLNGLILTELGRIPDLGEKFVIDNYIFEILKSNERMIEQVTITMKAEADERD